MDYKIVVPVYLGAQAVENLIASIDVDYSHLILVDNTPDSYCKQFEGKGISIYYYPENIGVGRAWNIGLKANADWTFILSQAVVFPSKFSEFLLEVDSANGYCYFTDLGWHCAGIARRTVEKVGLFDTNFYPAYFEDADYYRRMCLAGIEHGRAHTPPVMTSSVGSSSGRGKDINFKALYDYFVEKWGGGPNDDPANLYSLPFNQYPLDYFPERSVKELQNKYGY